MCTARNQHPDCLLLLAIFTQLIAGALCIYTSSASTSLSFSADAFYFIKRYLVVLPVFLFVSMLLYRYWDTGFVRDHIRWFLLVPLLLLLATLIPAFGVSINGASRWLAVGPFRLQVLPIAMPLIIIFIAELLSRHVGHTQLFSSFSAKLLATGLAFLLLTNLQPDLSGGVLLLTVLLILCFVARLYRFASLALVLVVVGTVLMAFSKPYWLARISTYLDPWADRFNSGYQLSTALTAISGGDLWGVGYTRGLLKENIPSAHDDFLFSVIVEETGVAGAGFVMLMSVFILWRCLRIAKRLLSASKTFEGLMVIGLSVWMALLATGHIAVNLGLVPTFSVPFPLLSYGNSYLLAYLLSYAVIFKLDSGLSLEASNSETSSTPVINAFPVLAGFILVFSLLGYSTVSSATLDQSLTAEYASLSSSIARRKARKHAIQPVKLSRSAITDRYGKPLAKNELRYDVWADPGLVELNHSKLQDLAILLSIDKQDMINKISRLKQRKRHFVYLKRGLAVDLAEPIKQLKLSGVYLTRVDRRYYPDGEASAHVVGIADIDNIGQEGIELQFDNKLRGKNRVALRLSIDKRIQDIAFQALKSVVTENEVKSGTIIVVRVEDGQILAMTNYPSFDPNNRRSISNSSLRNNAISMRIEPGALIAPFTLLSARNDPKYQGDVIVDTNPGYLQLNGHKIKDRRNFGEIDLSGVLTKYSKVGLSKIALDMPRETLWQMINSVGFGAKTKIELPGEVIGHLNNPQDWSDIEHAGISFGYGLSVTPVQVASAYMAIANNGEQRKLTLLLDRQPKQDNSDLISPASTQQIKSFMRKEGIPSKSLEANDKFSVSGNLALIQKNSAGRYIDKYTGAFAGFAPIENPEILAVVILDESGKDQTSTARLAEEVFYGIVEESMGYVRQY